MGVQIDAVEAKLLPLRQDLQLAQGEQQQLTKAVEAFESRLQGTEESWKKVQQQMETINKATVVNFNDAYFGPAANAAAAPAPTAAEPPVAQTKKQ